MWVKSLDMIQQITNGVDVLAGQFITMVLGLGHCTVGHPPPVLPTRLSSLPTISLGNKHLTAMIKGWGEFSCPQGWISPIYTMKANSTMLSKQSIEPGLISVAADKGQAQFNSFSDINVNSCTCLMLWWVKREWGWGVRTSLPYPWRHKTEK